MSLKNITTFFLLICVIGIHQSCKDQKQTIDKTNYTFKSNEKEFTIAFGSCNKHHLDQPLWDDILLQSPDLWIWLGDNIYANTEDMSEMKKKYDLQKVRIGYAALQKNVPIIGIWDDNDYGSNDGDKYYDKKLESKTLALDFLDVSTDAEVRNRAGMHQEFLYDFDGRKIRVLLLDTRSFRDPMQKVKKKYIPDASKDILGSEQWTWLEQVLSKDEDVLIIGSGIQFLPEEHRFEKWSNFPTSKSRLLDLLKKENTNQIILISGDRHLGEMSKLELENKTIYEVTSSGLTHSYRGIPNETNRYRIDSLIPKLNFGIINIKEDLSIDLLLRGDGQHEHLKHNIQKPE